MDKPKLLSPPMLSMPLKISIVTPCYNAEQFLNETLQSLLYQKGNFQIEHILIDGGSHDGTLRIIDQYQKTAAMLDSYSCVSLISEPDQGMYDALAKGLQQVTGEIVTYLNSDDYYLPNALSTIAEVFNNNPDLHWITGASVTYNNRGQIIGNSFLPFKFCRNLIRKGVYGTRLPFIQQPSTFWRSSLNQTIQLDRLRSFKYAGDFYLWYHFAEIADLEIINTMIAGHRLHQQQLSAQIDKYMAEFWAIADHPTFADQANIALQRLLNFGLNEKFKLALNRDIINYGDRGWVSSV